MYYLNLGDFVIAEHDSVCCHAGSRNWRKSAELLNGTVPALRASPAPPSRLNDSDLLSDYLVGKLDQEADAADEQIGEEGGP